MREVTTVNIRRNENEGLLNMIRWRKLTSKASTFLKLTYYDINHSDTTRLDFSAHGPAGYGRSLDSTLE